MTTTKNIIMLVCQLSMIGMLFANTQKFSSSYGEPISIEVSTKYKTIKEALTATKLILLQEKFIAENGIQDDSFTAKMTTGSKADYYVAEVLAERDGDKIKVSIIFRKIGTGLKNVKKIAEKVREKLEN